MGREGADGAVGRSVGWTLMRIDSRRTAVILLGLAIAGTDATAATSAPAAKRHGPAVHGAAAHRPEAHGPEAHGPAAANPRAAKGAGALRRPTFRAPRFAAAQEAARLGTTIGNGCNGKADIQRNERQWVVLCSNGKSYLVDVPPAGTPAVECSLAGTGPGPACFSE
jgi:hypothetical protein